MQLKSCKYARQNSFELGNNVNKCTMQIDNNYYQFII